MQYKFTYEYGTCRRATLCSLLLFMKLGLHSTSRPKSLPFCLNIHSCTTRPSFVIVTANCFPPAVTSDRTVFSPDPSCSPTMSELVKRNNYASRANITSIGLVSSFFHTIRVSIMRISYFSYTSRVWAIDNILDFDTIQEPSYLGKNHASVNMV